MNAVDVATLARIEELSVLEPNTGCQLWLGHGNPCGYGQLSYRGRHRVAHKVHYEIIIGPVPDGLQLDHLCRVRCCVNLKHLEPVTPRENILRGISPAARAVKTNHCVRGHPLSGDNLFVRPSGDRVCRTCRKKFHDESRLREQMEKTPEDVEYMREYGRRRWREAQCRKCRHVEKSHVTGGCVTQDGDQCGCLKYVPVPPRAAAPRET